MTPVQHPQTTPTASSIPPNPTCAPAASPTLTPASPLTRRGALKLLAPLAGCCLLLALWGCRRDEAKWSRIGEAPEAPPASPAPAASSHGMTTPPAGMAPHEAPQESVRETSAGLDVSGIRLRVPASWQRVPLSSQMRVAQYRLSGPGGEAEAAFFFFGPEEGGPTSETLARWAGQFSPAQASATREETHGALKASVLQLSGAYSPDMMEAMRSGGNTAARPDYALYGVIVEGNPRGRLMIKATGPKSTLEANREGFEALLSSLELQGS